MALGLSSNSPAAMTIAARAGSMRELCARRCFPCDRRGPGPHGPIRYAIRLSELRRGARQVGRALRSLRGVEHARRGERAGGGAQRHARRRRQAAGAGRARGQDLRPGAPVHRDRRARPRAWRRPGRGLHGPDRRRPRHRQVDPGAAGRGGAGARRGGGGLRQRRGVDRPDPPARRPPRRDGGAGAAERGDLRARHPWHVRSGGRATAPGDRARSRRCSSTTSRRRPAP